MNVLFEGIRVLNPAQALDGRFSLWLKDGRIVALSHEPIVVEPTTQRIPASHLLAVPGLFDMHVHLREPGQTHKEDIASGTAAAANGGFTGICCMPNTEPAIDHPVVLKAVLATPYDAPVDLVCCAALTRGRSGQELAPLLELHAAGAVMFSDDGTWLSNAELLRRAFRLVSSFNGLVAQHCQEPTLTEGFAVNDGVVATRLGLKGYPAVAEEIAIARDLLLAAYCQARYHVQHVSTRGAVALIREAKRRGVQVSCEVTPHHLVLTEEAVGDYDTNAKMNPPLRTQADVDALREALADGTIDCIATDHAPHATYEKQQEFEAAPHGVIGLETAVGVVLTHLVHTGILSYERFVQVMAIAPRQLLGLPLPEITPGAQANLTIIAPEEEWTVSPERFCSKARNTPFAGWTLRGKPKWVINRGQMWECQL
ncbi:MAG: dihydroorotase [Candidatus Kapabacteria bacterium]|nr:dihydroorotase [Candidatus Kapabacteria bacterium]MDW8012371.1 dihydroorotase [Bacteroidota bacterium]